MSFAQWPRVITIQGDRTKRSNLLRPALERLEGREVPAGISVVYSTTQDWGSGFQGSVSIKNETSAPVNNWNLEFDWSANVSSIWDAKIASRLGNHYVIANAGWNGSIGAGATVTFGLIGAPGAVAGAKPTGFIVNGAPLDANPVLPVIAAGGASVVEGNTGTSSLVFPVSLSAKSTSAVTVAYRVDGITATAGQDFTASTGTVTFAPGETSKTVTIAVTGDKVPESDETVRLTLSAPTAATLGTSTATGTIVNDDTAAGTGDVRFEVTSDWGSGYNGKVTLTNSGAKALTGWRVSFDYDGTIGSIWDATVISHVGNRWTVGSAGWNDTIATGASVSFGYGGVAGKTIPRPTNFALAGGSVANPTPVTPPAPPPANLAPTAVDDSAAYMAGSPVVVQPLANDTDPERDTLSITAVGNASGGVAKANADGSITYTPNAGFKGADSFTYTIGDGNGNSAKATVRLSVMAEGVRQWPGQVFAPYVDMTLWPTYDLASAARNQGIRHFNLAFVVAAGNGAPCWGGQSTYGIDGSEFDTKLRAQVQSVRALGGDVAVSFGGANGQELAEVLTDPAALKAAYVKVIDAYGLTRIDFDIEGAGVNNRAAIDRRNSVVAQIQNERAAVGKGLEVWYTLPVLPTGLTADGLYVVNSAIKAGVGLGGVNIMAMDYGSYAAPNPDGRMGDYAIQAATSLHAQLKQALPSYADAKLWSMVGVTPMIGRNDVTTEVFDQTEARELVAFASQKGISMISMWSLSRDQQNPKGLIPGVETNSSSIVQQPFEFSKIFMTLESASTPPAPVPAPTPTVSIAKASVVEGNTGMKSLDFVVSLSAASSMPVSLTVNTANGTATAGTDYQALSASTITIAAGATTATVSVPVIADTVVEPDETLTVTISAATGAAIATASATGTISNDDVAPNPVPAPGTGSQKRVVGYFTEWGIYGRNYTVADLPVDKLTTINYAFANISDQGEVAVYDSWAAVEKPFGSDTWNTPLRGNYHQLQLLKQAHPNLEILISIGGWTLSGKFSDVALTEASRAKFAASCVQFCNKYGFDGVDLDWEYPVSGGLESNTYRPEDKHNYTLLTQEIRRQFNAADALDGKHRLITIAAPAGYDKFVNYELAAMSQSLDWMNIMTYDYHGSWENTTNHQAAIYGNPNDQSSLRDTYTVAYTVDAYLRAGVAPDKLVLGAPIYGRSWRGVGPTNNGLFQPASGAGSGTWENGSVDYADLLNKTKTQPSVYSVHWDEVAQVPYVYAPTVEGGWFSTFENTRSLEAKIDYLLSKDLGGLMFWEASGDVRDSNSPDSLIGTAARRLM